MTEWGASYKDSSVLGGNRCQEIPGSHRQTVPPAMGTQTHWPKLSDCYPQPALPVFSWSRSALTSCTNVLWVMYLYESVLAYRWSQWCTRSAGILPKELRLWVIKQQCGVLRRSPELKLSLKMFNSTVFDWYKTRSWKLVWLIIVCLLKRILISPRLGEDYFFRYPWVK